MSTEINPNAGNIGWSCSLPGVGDMKTNTFRLLRNRSDSELVAVIALNSTVHSWLVAVKKIRNSFNGLQKFFISSFEYQAVPVNRSLAPAGNMPLYSFLLALPECDQIACLSEQVLLLALD